MILFELIADEYAEDILNTLAIVVIEKHYKEDPLNTVLINLMNQLAAIKVDTTIQGLFHVMCQVEKHNKYTDDSIIETFLCYHDKTKGISLELINMVHEFINIKHH